MAFSFDHFKTLIKVAVQNNASDIHIRSGEGPCLRIRGDLVPVKANKNITPEDIKDIFSYMCDDEDLVNDFNKIKDHDGVFELKDTCRIRYNLFKYNNKPGLIMRIVGMTIPSIDELSLASSLKEIIKAKRGLILVTGATGSGKSTTLASMINEINERETRHIITIEDPIEFLHPQKKSRISQREVGVDTDDFQSGLRSALRQDPDVILLGELRDGDAIATALKAAETGHLVLATIHTTDALSTVGRLLGMFPPEEQDDVRKRLSESLYATISQRMLKGKEKGKVFIAQEVMITNPGVKECIRGEEPLAALYSNIERGGPNNKLLKSQTFDQHIHKLFKDGKISQKEAEKSVKSQSDFVQKLIVVE